MYIDVTSFFKGREISSMNDSWLLAKGNIFDSKGVYFWLYISIQKWFWGLLIATNVLPVVSYLIKSYCLKKKSYFWIRVQCQQCTQRLQHAIIRARTVLKDLGPDLELIQASRHISWFPWAVAWAKGQSSVEPFTQHIPKCSAERGAASSINGHQHTRGQQELEV